MAPFLLLLAAARLASPAGPSACSDELFRIERSKNANAIVYELQRGADGRIDRGQAVRASWIMLAEHGQREDLNFLERMLAYGFEVKEAAPRPGWILTLKAEKNRPLHVREVGACTYAMVAIGGREGALKRVYVKADDRQLIPPIDYVEVFGVDPGTGAALYEKITPARQEQPTWNAE